jgi:hypothetical protein
MNAAAHYVIKLAISASLVVLISEVSKRSSLVGAVLASVPIVSVLAMIWLYQDTHDVAQVASLARGVLWLVLPSLALFAVLPAMLVRGYGFYLSLTTSTAVTVVCYFVALLAARALSLTK